MATRSHNRVRQPKWSDESERSDLSSANNLFALSTDFGSVANITDIDRAVWVIGVLRDPVINYRAANGFMEARRPYWVTRFTSAQDAVRRPTSHN